MNKPDLSGLSYHRMTAHRRNRLEGAVMDWANQPDVFKHYSQTSHTPLIPRNELPGNCLWDLVSGQDDETVLGACDLASLSAVLTLGNGITFERMHGGVLYSFRSAASAGALYPVELYVEAIHVEGLDPGLYHVDIRNASLACLKKQGNDISKNQGPWAVIYMTGMMFRSAWKYRKRAYRYILNDLGHVAANIILAARAHGLRPVLSCDFPDEMVNSALGLDPSREVCLSRIELWASSSVLNSCSGEPLFRAEAGAPCCQSGPVSAREIVYPEITDIHGAGSGPVKATEVPPDYHALKERVTRWETLPESSGAPKQTGLGEAITKRRSRRNFVNQGLSRDQALALIGLTASAWRMIERDKGVSPGLVPGFLCGNVLGLEPGFYLIDASSNRFGMVEEGVFTPSMAGACLDQMWLRSAGLQFLMIGDLNAVDDTWGPRGYRHVMIDAGILGQTIYLGATALGLGCCGIGAFYDDEAAHILDLQNNEYLLYLVAAGQVKTGCFMA